MSKIPKKSQLVVIGAGPGGYAAAFRAAELGMDVTLIDPETNPGGVCLYRGCIPSKALLHVAKLVSETREATEIGVTFAQQRRGPVGVGSLARCQVFSDNDGACVVDRHPVPGGETGHGTTHRVRAAGRTDSAPVQAHPEVRGEAEEANAGAGGFRLAYDLVPAQRAFTGIAATLPQREISGCPHDGQLAIPRTGARD
ncbi:MAG: FAD-dependent oxidoreductase [Desulfuromonadales bacterium]